MTWVLIRKRKLETNFQIPARLFQPVLTKKFRYTHTHKTVKRHGEKMFIYKSRNSRGY